MLGLKIEFIHKANNSGKMSILYKSLDQIQPVIDKLKWRQNKTYMRKLILDTETTGLDYNKDRIIECACLELIDNQHTEKRFHNYYNPS